ncbi:MAG: leucine-rich repeat domain-containing protein, partial [Prevotellaceae bacterium]|nr:leucine-rich repeat domain-containing protein [Prevotellaceae bacterium]
MKPNHRFLVLALVLCGISAGANAQAFTYEGINYQVTSTSLKEVKVAGNSGYSGEAVIPDSVVYNSDTYAVTEIGNEAFYNCSGLTGALTIPNSVTSIGYEAFRDCSGLTGIDVATGNLHYSSLDGVLFNEVQDTLIQYPGGKASSYIIPESVKTIGDNAFRNCSGLTGTLTIGNSVTSIGNLAFSGCSGFNGTLTIGNSVISIGNYAFSGCSGLTGALTIPNSVTSIGKQAFFNCSGLTGTLTIGNSVTSIGSSAFYGCRGFNGTLTIGNSVTSIGDQAFYYCRGLTGTLTIPNSVTSIGNNAFYGCRGFNGTLTIGNSVKTIGGLAFSDCSGLTGALTIPDSVTSIGERAFSGCSSFNGALTIPDSVTSIGNYAFSGCSSFNGALTIPNSVKTIGEGAFSGCSSFNGALTIPNSVISIGERAFYGCSGFNGTLTIPNSVTEIGTFAFSGCSGLTSIYVSAAIPPSVGANAFIYVPVGIPVHIPCGSTSAYQGAAEWSGFTNYINRPFNLTVQSEGAIKGTASITQANTCNNNTAIIAATSAHKHDFTQWSDGNTDNPRTLTLTQDTALTAQFASLMYDFSAVNEGQKIYYNITSSVEPLTVEVTYATASTYNDYSGAVVIPATVINRGSTYSVTAIGASAFRASTGLTSV